MNRTQRCLTSQHQNRSESISVCVENPFVWSRDFFSSKIGIDKKENHSGKLVVVGKMKNLRTDSAFWQLKLYYFIPIICKNKDRMGVMFRFETILIKLKSISKKKRERERKDSLD